ncbi:universal stress protein [Alkalilimnicola ehrlichii MLHE-1]|uniref:UspA domain protein n=1 Tax=Alkalilimnicola ehrlichii (strain ATCC BAA-1101 / DSM 17681 / MLHE-1) TaxID=187272 RepID=Q0AC76_ALKEH|nr:universal stress protein [Alkalilimnicola ehrlichii]ABI55561.1 UspA domain protein [Alkalilimnicola ehrlichii MLHE-1]
MSERVALVILPVDGSPACVAAAGHAGLLAQVLHARLQLVHVMPPIPAEFSDLPANRKPETDQDRAEQLENARQAFEKARAILDPSLEPECLTLEPDDESLVHRPGRVVADHVRRQSDCLLVLGARHMSDLVKLVEGSVSNEILHRVQCPVTVVHDDAEHEGTARLGLILLPVDGSGHSQAAAALAGDMARNASVPVELIFCQPRGGVDPGDEKPEAIFARAREALGKVPSGVEETLLTTARPSDAIVKHARARQDQSPTVIMGRHGRGVLGEALIGSVSHRVVETAPCPVTVVI